mmetsp:Transcript_32790/g.71500  ORF Transcript_32790/g.71500 Transcript_32790/m.71500 type:complete len:105 (+) Transcript_32790:388-702(+)
MVADIIDLMQKETKIDLNTIRVDGGATQSHLLMQIQANILGKNIWIPEYIETTSLGAAIGAKKFAEGIKIEQIKEKLNYKIIVDKTTKFDKVLRKQWNNAIQRT